jgi:dipeptidase E
LINAIHGRLIRLLSSARNMATNLLLLNNSRAPDGTCLLWSRAEIEAFLGPQVKTVHFIPYAAVPGSFATYDDYAQRVLAAFAEMGYALVSLHETADPAAAVRAAGAIVVGGGNTFHLLKQLYVAELVELIAERVRAGTRYIGWSAGSVLAWPTISTTNDMPIIEPRSLRALGLVPFQINVHYNEAHPPDHQGETRAERIAQFLSVQQPSMTVICLREGCLLHVEGAAGSICTGHARRSCCVIRAVHLSGTPAPRNLYRPAYAAGNDYMRRANVRHVFKMCRSASRMGIAC